jgi:hypothetical protein
MTINLVHNNITQHHEAGNKHHPYHRDVATAVTT